MAAKVAVTLTTGNDHKHLREREEELEADDTIRIEPGSLH
jgi:hypothetical protein